MKRVLVLLWVIAALALADAAYQLYRAVDDSRMHCGRTGLGAEACRSLRHGFVHLRLIAGVEAFAVAAVVAGCAGALAWRSRRRP